MSIEKFTDADGHYDARAHALSIEADIRRMDAERKAPKITPKPNEPTRADLAAVKDLSRTARQYDPTTNTHGRSGVLATVRPAPGSRNSVVRGEPTENDLVTVDLPSGVKMELSLRQAEEEGFVYRDGAGRFRSGPQPRDPSGPAATPQGASGPQGDPDVGVTLDATVEAGIGEVHALLETQWGTGAAPALLSRLMATGQMPSEVRHAADKAGVSYNDVLAKVQAFAEATAAKVQEVVESEGVDDPEGFMEWARYVHGPIKLQGLDLAFYTTGSVAGYRALAREYRESSARTSDKTSGSPKDIVTAVSDDGQEVKMTRGGARKLGWRITS